jgi:hypothetical protein
MVLSFLLLVTGESAVVGARAEVDAVGHRTALGVIDALTIHATLADADRLAANEFLLGASGTSEARQEYLLDIKTATSLLEQAAELNGPDGLGGGEIQDVSAMLAQYVGLVETARASARQSPSIGAPYLRQASALMHAQATGILARLDALATVKPQERAAEDTTTWLLLSATTVFFVLAAVLLGLLLYTQGFLRRRFRRLSSPPLVAATALLLLLSAALGAQFLNTYRNLSTAEGVAFTSLHRLSLMRSLAADANADESLLVIARGSSGSGLLESFKETTRQLADPFSDASADAGAHGDIQFTGLVADALRSADTAEERFDTLKVLRGYEAFMDVDASLRAKAAAGDYAGATALVVGSTQFGTAFADLDVALERLIDYQQARFDAAVADASPSFALDVGIVLVTIAIPVLVLLGLRPRIAEYTA